MAPPGKLTESSILDVLKSAASAVAASLSGHSDWGPSGVRAGQYSHDLVADEAAIAVITGAGMGVLSEESGFTDENNPLLVVLDPVDGSTNAALGLPWWATSMCVLDSEGPLCAVVVNQATGKTYEAVRGGGALCDGSPIKPSEKTVLAQSIIGFTGYPSRHLGWNQYRTLGAAALDLCAVADGSLDGFADCMISSIHPWDYLGGMLVCLEAGAYVGDADGRELVIRSTTERRAPVAGATRELQGELRAALLDARGNA